jgi:hypothetical protein
VVGREALFVDVKPAPAPAPKPRAARKS